jgi:hypothetical protein
VICRSFYANGPLLEPPGANLNGGLHQSMRLLDGHGLTTTDGGRAMGADAGLRVVLHHRGDLFSAIVSGGSRDIDRAASDVVLFRGARRSSRRAAMQLFTPSGVWAAGILIAWLPKQLGFTQVDAVIAPPRC